MNINHYSIKLSLCTIFHKGKKNNFFCRPRPFFQISFFFSKALLRKKNPKALSQFNQIKSVFLFFFFVGPSLGFFFQRPVLRKKKSKAPSTGKKRQASPIFSKALHRSLKKRPFSGGEKLQLNKIATKFWPF